MSIIYESDIEKLAIVFFKSIGWNYIVSSEINRKSFEDVLLLDILKSSLIRINPNIPKNSIEDAIKELENINSPDLISNNYSFHSMLVQGIKVIYRKNNEDRGDLVRLVDFDNPYNNDFLVTNQFIVKEKNIIKRLDIVLFINGIPIGVMELKNPAIDDKNDSLKLAYTQIQNYKQIIPCFFVYNEIIIISNGFEAKIGSLSSEFDRFMAWKSIDGEKRAHHSISQLEVLIKGILNKERLLDYLRFFIIFTHSKKEDKFGQTIIKFTKKIAAYHQYFAVNKAVKSTLRAIGKNKETTLICKESPSTYGLPNVKFQSKGDKKAGVIWHTQGSGKSLSMVFYSGKIVQLLNNPTIVVITDRNDLDDQLFNTFAASTQLLRQEPVQAKSREHLKNLLKISAGGIIFTTIHKFWTEKGNIYETLSERHNIIVIVDEAHRTQYGFKAKIDKKTGNIKYGFAKYLRDAFPNATYIAFTGTPIEKDDRNTPGVFGNYIDVYDISHAVKDGITVPIYYESRLIKINLTEQGKKLLEKYENELEEKGLLNFEKTRHKWAKLETLIGSNERIKKIAEDIVTHFEKRLEIIDGKGMIVTMTRKIAVKLYNEIIKIRPNWHSNDLKKGKIKVIMSVFPSDDMEISKFYLTKENRRILAERFKDIDDELKLVIVVDMWLTGFDVPCLHTMYIDKPMKGHTLMQAIARVNRVYKDKTGGLIVDYLGIAADLKQALSFYAESGGKGEPAKLQEEAVKIMLEKYEVVKDIFFGFDYKKYFKADTTKDKISIILEAENFILALESRKKHYIDAVTSLSKAFAVAIPHPKALEIKDDVAFFQTLKSRLIKFNRNNEILNTNETIIKQIIDKSIVSNGVIDIFDTAGIKKPDISILSDEFLEEIKGIKYKNIAIELLKKLINDEIKGRMKKNLVKSKSFMEILEDLIKKYNNKVLTASQIIEELINLAKEIKQSNKEPKEMGLTEYEYAFYTAVANNKSARELMGKKKLKELAIVLFDKVRKNTSIDWTIRESAKAKLRVIVKRTLKKYGYPPDMQALATETVLKQAELIAEEILSS